MSVRKIRKHIVVSVEPILDKHLSYDAIGVLAKLLLCADRLDEKRAESILHDPDAAEAIVALTRGGYIRFDGDYITLNDNPKEGR